MNGCNALGMLRESEYGGGAFWSSLVRFGLVCIVLELAGRGDQNTLYRFNLRTRPTTSVIHAKPRNEKKFANYLYKDREGENI